MPVLMLLVLLLYELINLSSHSSRQYICLIYYSFEGLQVSNRFISLIMSLIIIVSLIKYFCRKINYSKQWVRLNYATTHHHPPPPTTSQNISTTTYHHPPRLTTSQNISTTTHNHPKMDQHPVKVKIY